MSSSLFSSALGSLSLGNLAIASCQLRWAGNVDLLDKFACSDEVSHVKIHHMTAAAVQRLLSWQKVIELLIHSWHVTWMPALPQASHHSETQCVV